MRTDEQRAHDAAKARAELDAAIARAAADRGRRANSYIRAQARREQ